MSIGDKYKRICIEIRSLTRHDDATLEARESALEALEMQINEERELMRARNVKRAEAELKPSDAY